MTNHIGNTSRETPLEILHMEVGPDGVYVKCAQRGVDVRENPPVAVEVTFTEDDLTQAEHDAGLLFFAALERAAKARWDAWVADPQRSIEAARRAIEAQREAVRIEQLNAERVQAVQRLDAEIARMSAIGARRKAALERELTDLTTSVIAERGRLAEVTSELQAKRTEIETKDPP